jgi:DNA primase
MLLQQRCILTLLYMNSPVEKIKERLSIVDVISSYLQIEQSGKNYKAKCPFHNEKTPSFYISPDRGTYYCFGCGAKGDIFSFVQHFEGTDFLGSLKLLADRAGVPLERFSSRDSHDEKELWYEIMEEATKYFETEFAKQKAPRAYLADRGITDATIKLFRVGYAPDTWRSVSEHLLKKGYKKEDLEKVGLIKISDSGFYDRFRSRILFPISDSSGRVIAFSGRIFGNGDGSEAKYLNSPDTPLFNKSNVLFGIDKAKSAIRTRGYSIIVEGQMDLVMSHQAGFTNTVAVSGTAFADTTGDAESKINNLGLIRRLSPNIIFAFDGDTAGLRAASRASLIALSLDMQVKIALVPEGKDPADLIKENPDTWKDIIKHSVNVVSFYIDRICTSTTDIRKRGREIREVVFPFLSRVTSAIERSAYITEIYSKTGISERAVIEDFEMYERMHPAQEVARQATPAEQQTTTSYSRRDHLERRMFGIMFWQKENPEILTICDAFEGNIGTAEFTAMQSTYEPFADSLAFEAETWYGSHTTALARDMNEITLSLEEELLTQKKQSLQPLNTQEKLAQFNTIIKRIEEIKRARAQ